MKASGARKDESLSQRWTGNQQLDAFISELERLATGPAPRAQKRDPAPIDQVLSDIIAWTNDGARAALEPNRMAGLEL